MHVNREPDDDDETVIARAKAALRRKCGGAGIYPVGPCYESWHVNGDEEED